jgi:hypothetical protein
MGWRIRGFIPGVEKKISLLCTKVKNKMGPTQPLFIGYVGHFPRVKAAVA